MENTMKSQPTDGTWSVSNGRLVRIVALTTPAVVICGVHRIGSKGGKANGDALANAYLLSAAKEMRAALGAILHEIDIEIDERQTSGLNENWKGLKVLPDAGHAALAKAKGR